MKKLLIALILFMTPLTILANKGEDYESYQVIFNIDGELLKFDVKAGEPIGSIQKPVKEGYDFIGWYLNGVKYNFDKPVTKDIELIATFEKEEPQEEDEEKEVTEERNNTILIITLTSILFLGTTALFINYKRGNKKIDF